MIIICRLIGHKAEKIMYRIGENTTFYYHTCTRCKRSIVKTLDDKWQSGYPLEPDLK